MSIHGGKISFHLLYYAPRSLTIFCHHGMQYARAMIDYITVSHFEFKLNFMFHEVGAVIASHFSSGSGIYRVL